MQSAIVIEFISSCCQLCFFFASGWLIIECGSMYLPVMWEECEVFHVLFSPEIRSKKEEIWEVLKAKNLQKESKIYD